VPNAAAGPCTNWGGAEQFPGMASVRRRALAWRARSALHFWFLSYTHLPSAGSAPRWFWPLAPWRAAAAQPACNPNSEAPTRLPVSATLAKALRPPTTVSLSRWAAPARTCFFRIETVYESVGTRPPQWPTPRQNRGRQGAIGAPAGRNPVPPAILHHAIQGTAVVAAGGWPDGAREALFGGAVTPMSRYITSVLEWNSR